MMVEHIGVVAPRGLRVEVRSRDALRASTIANILTEACHQIVEHSARADVIVYDSDGEIESADMGRAVVIGGATGAVAAAVLPWDASATQIEAAVRAVAAGLWVRAPRAYGPGFGPAPEQRSDRLLTPRELEVLTAIGEGLSNKAIARRLEISLHTVKFHIESIFRKLDVRTRTEAVAKGRDRTLVEL